jgi:FkbM family methyltransferase
MTKTLQRISESCARQVECSANGLRFGFLFVRARWFRMPRSIRVAGRKLPLHYPAETGVQNDFFACVIRNEYGLGHGLHEVRTILDVGANIGFFSVAARARYPHARIHAYEPNPRVVPLLESNTAPLGIEIHAEAVGAWDGRASMLDAGDSNQARTQASEAGNISQVSLEKAIDRLGGTVDLLKLDCEGAEWELFRAPEAWKRVRNIRMEYHLFRGETIAQVEESLNGLGFEVTHLQPGPGFGMAWATARGSAGLKGRN